MLAPKSMMTLGLFCGIIVQIGEVYPNAENVI